VISAGSCASEIFLRRLWPGMPTPLLWRFRSTVCFVSTTVVVWAAFTHRDRIEAVERELAEIKQLIAAKRGGAMPADGTKETPPSAADIDAEEDDSSDYDPATPADPTMHSSWGQRVYVDEVNHDEDDIDQSEEDAGDADGEVEDELRDITEDAQDLQLQDIASPDGYALRKTSSRRRRSLRIQGVGP